MEIQCKSEREAVALKPAPGLAGAAFAASAPSDTTISIAAGNAKSGTLEARRIAEDTLARRCVNGDMTAADELVRSLKRVVFSALISSGVPASCFDDCFQATSLRIIEKIGSWRGDGRIASWAYAVAKSTARDFLRAVRDLQLEPDDAEFLQNRRSESPLIDDSLIDARRREFLRCVVAELPEVLSETAALFYYSEMKVDEIAATLDTPLNTVKSRLLRARAALIERAISEGWRVKGVRTNDR
jgi:RNA polymerase sigma-70 factor (ECF subfamily)